jgi:hypothetical protein
MLDICRQLWFNGNMSTSATAIARFKAHVNRRDREYLRRRATSYTRRQQRRQLLREARAA